MLMVRKLNPPRNYPIPGCACCDAKDDRIRELEAALAAEKENARIGWANFETFRRKYAEIRFPGMTGEVHSASDAEGEP
jgi:hypothetical protein